MTFAVRSTLAALLAISLLVQAGCSNPKARDWETDKFWKDRDPVPPNRS